MTENEFVGCWYFYIHAKLKEKARGDTINYNDAKSFLFEWRLPKFMRSVIMRELEILNLIERLDKKTILIKESKVNLENPSMFYDMVGLIPKE